VNHSGDWHEIRWGGGRNAVDVTCVQEIKASVLCRGHNVSVCISLIPREVFYNSTRDKALIIKSSSEIPISRHPQSHVTCTKKNSVAASELCRPSDSHLSAKLVPTFTDRGCRVVSATDPHTTTSPVQVQFRVLVCRYAAAPSSLFVHLAAPTTEHRSSLKNFQNAL
jgi:hypothetical protein